MCFENNLENIPLQLDSYASNFDYSNFSVQVQHYEI